MNRKIILALALVAGCNGAAPTPGNQNQIPADHGPAGKQENNPGQGSLAQDGTHKESPRLFPSEAYVRTYLRLFGGLSPLDAQTQLQAGGAGLFDGWSQYLAALGLPNYTADFPRGAQTNAVMIAAFDRLGTALCDKAIEKDLKSNPPTAVSKRLIYAFDLPKDPSDLQEFTARFDVLHRTFLSYPAKLAPTDRINRYFKLFQDTMANHPKDPKASKLTATEAGWAAMCYGLVRHPEFHLY